MNSDLNASKLEIQALQRIADSLEQLAQQQVTLSALLLRLTQALEQMAPVPTVPNYLMPLEKWRDFDWSGIKATVMASDSDGPTLVAWGGQQFTRRAPINKFDAAVWFSRYIGRDEKGELIYDRLITFKHLPQAEPVPERVRRLIHNI